MIQGNDYGPIAVQSGIFPRVSEYVRKELIDSKRCHDRVETGAWRIPVYSVTPTKAFLLIKIK